MSSKRYKRKYKKNKKSTSSFILSIIILVIAVIGYFAYKDLDDKGYEQAVGEISFHFMMLGNDSAGDCVYVKAGEKDILIDSGSDYDSIDDIKKYVDSYVSDGKLEYVIVSHADMDHIACLAGESNKDSLFDYYEVETIIDFPKTNKTSKVYERYQDERKAEIDDGGTVHYTALDCYNNTNGAKRVYELTNDGNIRMEILYNYYYENKTSNENDYSVCVMFHHGSRKFLFTGDLEENGEEKLAQFYDFDQVELFKSGHHGSYTASNECLLSEIKPKIFVATCCAGVEQYTDVLENTFPAQVVIDRIAKYTDKVYVPTVVDLQSKDGYAMLNGNIVVISEGEKEVYVNCSNNNTLLKDTDWFKQYRRVPSHWN